MGHRIELGEIETAVSSVKGVESNCCVFDDEKDMLIVCYIGAAEERELRLSLSSLLPEYMMPRRYCKLDNMPLNRNGKIDRVKMKAMFCPA